MHRKLSEETRFWSTGIHMAHHALAEVNDGLPVTVFNSQLVSCEKGHALPSAHPPISHCAHFCCLKEEELSAAHKIGFGFVNGSVTTGKVRSPFAARRLATLADVAAPRPATTRVGWFCNACKAAVDCSGSEGKVNGLRLRAPGVYALGCPPAFGLMKFKVGMPLGGAECLANAML